MRWAQVGGLAGFAIGFMSSFSLALVDVRLGGYASLLGGALGAAFGGWVGWHGGPLARWCGGTAAVVGGIAFSAGFFLPILLHPNSPQGPLLGIFFPGPLGPVAGALLGLIIGAVRESWQPAGGTRRQA